ncbi:MAG: hypothetical protein M0Q43_01130 [Methanothrix sp.]|jgi:hypothetical protein|nr:hypothetical protein [Methanothrix sp.]
MILDRRWIVYNTTEDDFIELERCTERLRDFGLTPDVIYAMALSCHTSHLSGHCLVKRENVFLGAGTC